MADTNLGGVDADFWYKSSMTKEQIERVLEGVRSWPNQDQEELAEVAREIEARRKGVYVLSDDERAAIAGGLASAVASGDEVAAFWKKHGVE